MDELNLDAPVFQFSKDGQQNAWTIRSSFEGCQITGGLGSGKSSGSGKSLALKYLSLGYAGLVLAVKPDEKDLWVDYCRQTGRLDDLIVIEPAGQYNFNFLDYEASNTDKSHGLTENLVDVFRTVIKAGRSEGSSGSDDSFWESAIDMLLFHLIDLCRLAYGNVSVKNMFEIAKHLPTSDGSTPIITEDGLQKLHEDQTKRGSKNLYEPNAFEEAMILANKNVWTLFEKWQEVNGKPENVGQGKEFAEWLKETFEEAKLFNEARRFFLDTYKNLSYKTRSIVDFLFQGFFMRLMREPIYSLFCKGKSNVTPEDCLNGKIILLNLPVKKYFKVGRDCQILFKYIWQRSMEKRNVKENGRPVFLWADEAQNFIHEHDTDYQATARSSRIATVYITQNLANYYANMGGDKSEHRVISFLGTLATKIFHANADRQTNEYASSLIGDGYRESPTEGYSTGKEMTISKSKTYMLERLVKPEEFVSLRTGGPLNEGIAEAYFHCQGYPLFDGSNHKKVRFRQDL